MNEHLCKSIFLLLCVVSTAVCSKCNYIVQNEFIEVPRQFIQAVCFNVSSNLSLELDPGETTLLIEALKLEHSKISVIPAKSSLSSLPILKEITLENLGIEKVTPGAFDDLVNLKEVDLSNNRLAEILPGTFNKLHNLEILDLEGNIITSISAESFKELKLLTILDLSENLLTDIDEDSFTDLVALERLDLSGNNLTILEGELFKNLRNVLVNVGNNPLKKFEVSAKSMDISNTDLKDISFSISQDISTLVISRSHLEEVDFAKFSGSIEYLSLHENHITTIKNLNLANIQTLNLDENNITVLETIPQNVTSLSLQKNQIKTLTPVSDPTKYVMESLDLDDNEITVASCFGLASLQNLHLENNKIDAIKKDSFVGCTNLSSLYLSNNKIESIEANAFSGSPLLDTVSLSNNNLRILNYESFLGLNSLQNLYFDHNQITSFDVDSFANISPILKYIKMDNPFSCEDLTNIFVKLRWYHISPLDVTYINYEKYSFRDN